MGYHLQISIRNMGLSPMSVRPHSRGFSEDLVTFVFKGSAAVIVPGLSCSITAEFDPSVIPSYSPRGPVHGKQGTREVFGYIDLKIHAVLRTSDVENAGPEKTLSVPVYLVLA